MNVAAIVLAAGGSSRLGAPKQLVRIDAEALVRRAARACLDSRCARTVVVRGAAGDAVLEALVDLDVESVVNPDWREGLGTSIRCGVEFVGERWPETEAVLLVLADQPRVDAALLDQLVDAAATQAVRRVGCRYAGSIGVPALFKQPCWDALRALTGDRGARSLLAEGGDDLAWVSSELPAVDVDTAADVAALGAEIPLPDALRQHMREHSRAFLLSVRSDGSPTAHPMTALLVDGRISFNTYRKSAKTRNVERNPRMGAVLLNGYSTRRVEEVSGFCVHGTGAVREAAEMTEQRGDGPEVSETVKQRVAKRLEAGKRILLELAAVRVRKIGD